MAKAKKAAKTKKAKVSKSPAKKKKVAVKKKVARTVVKKKAARVVVKKKVAKKSVVKKKAAKTAVRKKAAKSAVKNKLVAKGPSTASKAKILRATIAALKEELKGLKNDLKIADKRADAASKLTSQRDTAVGKFLSKWDKKASAAIDKSLQQKKRKKKKLKK